MIPAAVTLGAVFCLLLVRRKRVRWMTLSREQRLLALSVETAHTAPSRVYPGALLPPHTPSKPTSDES